MSLSLTEQELHGLIRDLAEADQLEKKAKKLKNNLRSTLFHYATVEGEKQVLPRKTMKLPLGFLNKIGMPENEFIASRFPGWRKVESRKVNDSGVADHSGTWVEYLLERDPAFLPYSTEVTSEGITITAGRTVQQNSPEIDQRTLQKDLPEVFDRIMKPVVNYEVDTIKLEEALAKNPELLPKLELHFAYPSPIAKLSPIKQREEEDGQV